MQTARKIDLTVREIVARPVRVPMKRPLATASGTIASVAWVVIDVITEEGVAGCGYAFTFFDGATRAACALIADMSAVLAGEQLVPAGLRAAIARRYKLIGLDGLANISASGVDVACWDALAKAHGVPLATLLGAAPKPVRAYNSNGLGLMAPAQLAREAEELVAEGFRAIKLRLGHPTLREDLAAVAAVQRAVPDDVLVMSDYNQALSLAEATVRLAALDALGLIWIEEPIRHDDYAGSAALARQCATPIQIGENFTGPRAMSLALAHGASDVVMPDLERIGGVSGWLEAAALANTANVPMSSHLFAEVSAQLLCATPTAHWLEYTDWAVPLLAEPLGVHDGCVLTSTRPGVGLTWDEAAVARYTI